MNNSVASASTNKPLEKQKNKPHEAQRHSIIKEALELFEGLTSLRPKQVNTLLQYCRSIKVKRLFLFMADQFSYPWISRIDKKQLDLGSGKRVVVKGGKLDKRYLITIPERQDG